MVFLPHRSWFQITTSSMCHCIYWLNSVETMPNQHKLAHWSGLAALPLCFKVSYSADLMKCLSDKTEILAASDSYQMKCKWVHDILSLRYELSDLWLVLFWNNMKLVEDGVGSCLTLNNTFPCGLVSLSFLCLCILYFSSSPPSVFPLLFFSCPEQFSSLPAAMLIKSGVIPNSSNRTQH